MPSSIPYSQTGVSNLKAPDLSKAGDLFNNALSRATNLAKGIKSDLQSEQRDIFSTKLREAQTQEDLADLSLEGLRQSDIDPTQLQAYQDQIGQKSTDIFGNTLQDQFTTKQASNLDAINKAIASSEKFQHITPDLSGTITGLDPEDTDLNQAFSAALRKEGFQGVDTTREANERIANVGKERNYSNEQIKKLQNDFKTYKKELNSLTEEEKLAYVGEESKINDRLAQQKLAADHKLRQIERDTGLTAERAQQLYLTEPKDINSFVDNKVNNKDVWEWFDESGAKLKNRLDNYRRKGINGVSVKPWMIMEALQTLSVGDPDDNAISPFELEEAILLRANDAVFANNMLTAAKAKENIDATLLINEQAANQAKSKLLKDTKRKYGIRDTVYNRNVAEGNILPRVDNRTAKQILNDPSNNTGGILPDVVNPNIEGFDPVKTGSLNPDTGSDVSPSALKKDLAAVRKNLPNLPSEWTDKIITDIIKSDGYGGALEFIKDAVATTKKDTKTSEVLTESPNTENSVEELSSILNTKVDKVNKVTKSDVENMSASEINDLHADKISIVNMEKKLKREQFKALIKEQRDARSFSKATGSGYNKMAEGSFEDIKEFFRDLLMPKHEPRTAEKQKKFDAYLAEIKKEHTREGQLATGLKLFEEFEKREADRKRKELLKDY